MIWLAIIAVVLSVVIASNFKDANKRECVPLHAHEAPTYEPITIDDSFAKAVESAYAAQGFRFDPKSFAAERMSVPSRISRVLPRTYVLRGGGPLDMNFIPNMEAMFERSMVRSMMDQDGVTPTKVEEVE